MAVRNVRMKNEKTSSLWKIRLYVPTCAPPWGGSAGYSDGTIARIFIVAAPSSCLTLHARTSLPWR
jgi:hypothetical protein